MFKDRKDAGSRLAERLRTYEGSPGVLVLALPRGGVVPAFEIARVLRAPLDVLIVRKVGFPWQPELAAGAVSETGTVVLNQSLIASGGVPKEYIDNEVMRQQEEIRRRVALYRGGGGIAPLEGKTIILVDDGVATGATMKAAIQTLRQEAIARLIVAIPVAPPATAKDLAGLADELVCLATPEDFMAVGAFYLDFTQVTDEEVVRLLRRAVSGEAHQAAEGGGMQRGMRRVTDRPVRIPADAVMLEGMLSVPEGAAAAVIFAHGSGSSRFSPRNTFVAKVLHDQGIATLLFDLLTADEDRRYENRFNIALLTRRLIAATDWLAKQPEAGGWRIGYFGASTGAAAALAAAAEAGDGIGAVVSRGGRPDLANDVLGRVTAPTLLIVGGRDDVVLQLNAEVLPSLAGEKELAVIPGATHLFEEPGALEEVARRAAMWFTRWLCRPARGAGRQAA